MSWLTRLFARGRNLNVPQVADPTDAPLPQVPVSFPQRAERVHHVREGETLESIARDVYGSPGAASRIFEANRTRLGDPAVLYPGQTLQLP